MKKIILLITISALCTVEIFAQSNTTQPQPELESGTIENQLDYVITKSSSFREFQLIRRTSILKVKENVLDSLKMKGDRIESANQSLIQSQKEIAQLQSEIVVLNKDLVLTAQGRDSISLFGSMMNKTAYNSMMWSIVALLLAALLFFIFQFKNSHFITKRTKQEYESLEDDFEAYKKKVLKKEQELMRKLQDELNKRN